MILNEISKNLKVTFRSISSASMLVIGPLLLILLIGFAFSGNSVHGIQIGVTGNIDPGILSSLANFSSVTMFSNSQDCIDELKQQQMHVCLDVNNQTIQFNYDNTREAISSKVIESISSAVGAKSEEISIENLKVVFGNIQQLVLFIAEKQKDISDVKNQSEQIREKLIERKQKLLEIQSQFEPSYTEIKRLQNQTKSDTQEFLTKYEILRNSMDTLISINNEIQGINITQDADNILIAQLQDLFYAYPSGTDLSTLNATKIYVMSELGSYALTNDSLYANISGNIEKINLSLLDKQSYISLIDTLYLKEAQNFNSNALLFENATQTLTNSTNATIGYIDSITVQLDNINNLLNEEITLTDVLINAIDSGTKQIEADDSKLSADLQNLQSLYPESAGKLINPITTVFNSLLPDAAKDQIAFPSLLTALIIFISLLFGNSITLSEIHSSAHFRNSIAPVSDRVYTLGLFATSIIVVGVQTILLLIIGQLKFGLDIINNILPIAAVCLMMIMIFSLIGMLIAFIFKNQQTSLITSVIAALAFFLFSSSITPLETMPSIATYLASLNPMVISETLLREIILIGVNAGLLSEDLIILAVYAIVLIVLVILSKIKS